jgi:hypothetical protein
MLCPLSVQPRGVGLLDGGSHGWCGLVVSSGGESDSYVVIIVSNEGRRQHYDGCCKLVVLSPGERDIVDFSPYSSSFIVSRSHNFKLWRGTHLNRLLVM